MSFPSEDNVFQLDTTGDDWNLSLDNPDVKDQVVITTKLLVETLMEATDCTVEEACTKIRWATHVLEGIAKRDAGKL